ncbi:Similar to DNA ligase 4; acc. no. Q4WVG8 [Pyronema omphalodes CBS 100304]|uniref:DNA ligase n=1 Tax=Pyronema omphalodes (strain CBS 100304) TaxID=1076935 RepID=U4LMU7_PYROM|nr:Similar to DNA ligase 4; acc. no. Q4WVG8 [Pyronema omphalodes CBS 100304]
MNLPTPTAPSTRSPHRLSTFCTPNSSSHFWKNKKKKPGAGLRGNRELKPHEIRRNIIDAFISKWRKEVGDDIFPAFRLILCEKDRDRNVYNLKEQKIGKLLVKVMKINKDSEDGYALLHWKEPGSWASSAGDFALRCYEVIKKRPIRTLPGTLTITEVNHLLDQLSSSPSDESQLSLFSQFYTLMSPTELMWLIRIILKQMKISATEKTFFDCFHPDAESLFSISSSLRRVCWELWDPSIRLEDNSKGVVLNSCFQPQLANFAKKSFSAVINSMPTPFWIEEKLDGERMQLHYSNGSMKWWSRKAKDYTHLYGTSFFDGAVAQFIKEAFDPAVTNCILDGEMITWDPVLDYIVAFGTLKSAVIEQTNNPTKENIHRPLFRVFDILFLNNKSLLSYTLSERYRALQRILHPIHRRIEIHSHIEATSAEEIEASLRKVIASSTEGLVIKSPLSVYRLNSRNDSWIKVKPEYMTEFGESLDLLVIGGYWGSGHRSNTLSSFLCGLRVDGNHASGDGMKFWSFCRVGGGFTAGDYQHIAHLTEGAWIEWGKSSEGSPNNSNNHRQFFQLGGGDKEFEKPNVWIHPEKSFVIEVKAAEVVESGQYRVPYTLRFPRFRRVREDKNWETSLGVQEFEALRQEVKEHKEGGMVVEKRRAGRKRVKKEFRVMGDDEDGEDGDEVPKFAPMPRGDSQREQAEQAEKQETQQKKPRKPLFSGLRFWVITESATKHFGKKLTKPALESLIKAHGGTIYQSETAAPEVICIGDRKLVKVAGLIKTGKRDIVKTQWVLDCIAQNELLDQDEDEDKDWDGRDEQKPFLLPLEQDRHLFFATPETEQKAIKNTDDWGDSYCRSITATDLGSLLSSMKPALSSKFDTSLAASVRENLELEMEALSGAAGVGEMPGWIFKGCRVFILVPNRNQEGHDYQILKNLVEFGGGEKVEELTGRERVSHVVVLDDTDGDVVQRLRKRVAEWDRIPRFVKAGWVRESFNALTRVDEERFLA